MSSLSFKKGKHRVRMLTVYINLLHNLEAHTIVELAKFVSIVRITQLLIGKLPTGEAYDLKPLILIPLV